MLVLVLGQSLRTESQVLVLVTQVLVLILATQVLVFFHESEGKGQLS